MRRTSSGSAASAGAGVFSTALRLLSRRELSTAELREKLADRGFDASAIEEAIARLTADGSLNDRRAARAIARTHAAVKGRGRLRIERDLAARGIPREIAREAVDEVFGEISEAGILERALGRRLRSGRIKDQAQFRRLYQYLVRLGFGSDQVLKALKKYSKIEIDF